MHQLTRFSFSSRFRLTIITYRHIYITFCNYWPSQNFWPAKETGDEKGTDCGALPLRRALWGPPHAMDRLGLATCTPFPNADGWAYPSGRAGRHRSKYIAFLCPVEFCNGAGLRCVASAWHPLQRSDRGGQKAQNAARRRAAVPAGLLHGRALPKRRKVRVCHVMAEPTAIAPPGNRRESSAQRCVSNVDFGLRIGN
jgi:hypothetical protein